MYGNREYRFSYTDENGEQQFVFLRSANVGGGAYLLKQRGIKFSYLKRAPLPKNKPLTTGHCQICEREIGTTTGLIAHHGYTRPGHGWQTASCFGAKWRPYEVACDALPEAIRSLEVYILNQEGFIASWMSEPPASIDYKADNWQGGRYVSKSYTAERPADFDPKAEVNRYTYPPCKYSSLFHGRISSAQMHIKFAKDDVKRLTKRLADWKEPK
jgi:hypothetical protein